MDSTVDRSRSGMLSLSTPGVLLVPAPATSPALDPGSGPVRTISYPCTEPRDTSVETSCVSWVLASKSLPLAADNRLWASAVARVDSATDDLVLLSTSPSVIWCSSTQPTSETTTADRRSVLITTRAWMDRRQTVTARRSSQEALTEGPRGGNAGVRGTRSWRAHGRPAQAFPAL